MFDSAIIDLSVPPTKELNWESIYGALKPGAHLLALCSVNYYSPITVAIEDCGFEIRDCLTYLYDGDGEVQPGMLMVAVARKPLEGTVAENTLKYGTGGLNIDTCRVNTEDNLNGGAYAKSGGRGDLPGAYRSDAAAGMLAPGKTVGQEFKQPQGRWPANLLHDNSPTIVAMFPDSKTSRIEKPCPNPEITGHKWGSLQGNRGPRGYDGDGSAARFFHSAPCLSDLLAYLIKLVTPPNGTVLTNCGTENLPNDYTYVANREY